MNALATAPTPKARVVVTSFGRGRKAGALRGFFVLLPPVSPKTFIP